MNFEKMTLLQLLLSLTICSKSLGVMNNGTRFIYPESGEIIHVDELFGTLEFAWAIGDDIPATEVFARFRKNNEMFVNIPLSPDTIRSGVVSIKGNGKRYGSHTVSVRHYVVDDLGKERFVGNEISTYFDVVPTTVEKFEHERLTPLLPTYHRTNHYQTPRVLIVAGISGINGQIELYIEQCAKLSRQRVRSIEWLLLSAVDTTDPTSKRTLELVEQYCDAVHLLPIKLSQRTYLEINATSNRMAPEELYRVLERTHHYHHLSDSMRQDLGPMITFLSHFDIVVFENENQRYFNELLRLANVKSSVLQITRPEYDCNYSHVSRIVTSSSYVSEMSTTLKIARKQGMRVEVFYPGVDLSIFSKRLYRQNMKRRGNNVRIGYVGRLVSEKSPYLMLRLVKELETRRIGRRIHLDFVGEGSIYHQAQDVATRLTDGTFSSTIMWHGFLNHFDLAQLMSTWDVLVFPSVAMETFGLVCIQAMAVGVSVVNFGIGGSRVYDVLFLSFSLAPCSSSSSSKSHTPYTYRYTHDGVTGFIAKNMSVDALVEATLRAIDSDGKIEENARRLVERYFNYDVYIERNARLYEELMSL